MAHLELEILTGDAAGRKLGLDSRQIRLGSGDENEVRLSGARVSAAHARIVNGLEATSLEDAGSAHGTAVIRGGVRRELDGERFVLEDGDVLELGGNATDGGVRLRVRLAEDADAHVVETRPLAALAHAGESERAPERLTRILAAQRALGATENLLDMLTVLSDAALDLVDRATHATAALLEPNEGDPQLSTLVTRQRAADGSKITAPGFARASRTLFRRVIRERAAVLAVDAPNESLASDSLLGQNVQSTIGVPLFRGQEILGVLQVDNRDAPAMFTTRDVEALGVLSENASLAVANARLIARLLAAEQKLAAENQFLKQRERERKGEVRLVGDSPVMAALARKLDKVVDTRVSVFIEGETGTGKELIAAAVHQRSKRRDKLFVAQNCAAFPENLLESELFGHKRGAFTGASEDKKGLFEIADGGTLFLDEIGELPLSLQAKLLRVLQEGEVRRLGATEVKHVDVRIVAATNRKLEDEVAAGRFREDLYYRLKVFPIAVPPLRDRREDIVPLAHHFLARYTREMGKAVPGFAQETLAALTAYDWPGNVRELENEVQRLLIQADASSFITPELLSASLLKTQNLVDQAGPRTGTLKERVEQVEKVILLEVLREHGNNKSSAARSLGITREGLHKKLKTLGLA
jgi:transcriptional regulator with GAF, ATPase, and Fis domain